ncbi:DnaJ family domain-containing protein [Flindersiella endophytica]
MTQRKPPGMGFETWIDKQIREAEERGEFDNLPGAGKPIPDIDRPYDEMRWVANWVRREGVPTEALLPTPLQLRKEIHDLPGAVRSLRTEQAVRAKIDELNKRIRDWTLVPRGGPQIAVFPVEADEVVDQWRADRARPAEAVSPADTAAAQDEQPAQRKRWWHRFGRRTA